MLRNLLTVAAAVALTAGLAAQSQAPAYKAVSPQFAGVYNMASGQLEGMGTTGSSTIYNNNTLTNYYSVPGADQEWIDEGQFCGQSTVQIDGFNFTYCSTEADATQNSGTFTFTFYDDFTICTGPSNGGNFANGGFVCAYDVVGLPLGDPNGVIQCWIVTVDLSGGFECPSTKATQGDLSADEANGKLFGWGIIPRNNNTGPWLSTGGKGGDNAFVWFDAFGIFQGCFWFGGTPFASFAIGLTGNANGDFCYYPANPGVGDNANFTICVDPGSVTITNNGGAGWLVASGGCAEIATPNCTALIDPGSILQVVPAPAGATTYPTPGAGIVAYVQVMETANGAPPSASNLPTQCSQAYCITTQ